MFSTCLMIAAMPNNAGMLINAIASRCLCLIVANKLAVNAV